VKGFITEDHGQAGSSLGFSEFVPLNRYFAEFDGPVELTQTTTR